MQIEKFIKQKNGQYKLILDNGEEEFLHEDLILKHELLLKRSITEELLEKLRQENETYIAYDLSIKYLGIKMRTKLELYKYLENKGFSKDLIDDCIKKISQLGYLDEGVYTKAFINDQINLSNNGPLKIKEVLLKNGISEDVINKEIVIFTDDIEKERIKKLIEKQIKLNRNKSTIVLKKHIQEYLSNLGYNRFNISEEINRLEINDQSIYEKEYRKVYSQLSKKYSGKELEYKVRQKLYQKGFINNNYE